MSWTSLGENVTNIPWREISLIVTPEGYYPKTFSVFAGEKVRFFITSTTEQKSCFILAEKKLFMAAEKGVLSEGQAYFEKPGRYSFHCPTGKIKGHLTVLPGKIPYEEGKDKLADWRPRNVEENPL